LNRIDRFSSLVLSWLCSLRDGGFFGQRGPASQVKCAQSQVLAAFTKSHLELFQRWFSLRWYFRIWPSFSTESRPEEELL
jgi:hypothetical protein